VRPPTAASDTHDDYQRRYFDRPADGNARLQPTDSAYVRRHLERVIAAAALSPGQRVLEVGAGLGRLTSLMVARGLDLVASDPSPELLAPLWARHPGLAIVRGPMAEVRDPAGRGFDRAVGFFVLHHVSDLDRAFAGLRRAMRPGGRIAFCEPNAYCGLYYLQIALSRHMTWRGDGGVRHMRPGVVLPSLRRAGFVDGSYERYGFAPPAVYEREVGRRLERSLEAVRLLEPLRAFQVFSASVP
jgi:SAM-dependent methyltransferase